jgi:hypothetical protein
MTCVIYHKQPSCKEKNSVRKLGAYPPLGPPLKVRQAGERQTEQRPVLSDTKGRVSSALPILNCVQPGSRGRPSCKMRGGNLPWAHLTPWIWRGRSEDLNNRNPIK